MRYIYSWNSNSKTAKHLSHETGFKRIRHENSKFKGGTNKIVINYGSSRLPEEVLKCKVINSPEAVADCSNKLRFFNLMDGEDGPRCPPWTTELATVREWVVKGYSVMARTVLQGHSGNGIVIIKLDSVEQDIRAPLYTRYVKKKDEYRVHVAFGKVIDFSRKALSSDVDKENISDDFFMVRNHEKGFVYVRGNVDLPEDVPKQALLAMKKSGLDYGAVDVIYNQKQNKAYVLEINSAPGMEGTTLNSYSNIFKESLNAN